MSNFNKRHWAAFGFALLALLAAFFTIGNTPTPPEELALIASLLTFIFITLVSILGVLTFGEFGK